MEVIHIDVKKLKTNKGQIEGLPTNPRSWTKEELEKLAKSLKETPELFEARGLIVYPLGDDYIVLGGNMRLAASKKNKAQDVPCIVMPEGTSLEKLKEIVIKDNGAFGEWDWDELANKWDDLPLLDWGVPDWEHEGEDEKKETEKLSGMEYNSCYYEPKEVPDLSLADCYNLEKYEAKIKALDEYDLTEKQKQILGIFACRFIKIDFEMVANYYAFKASEEEKKALERLRLVLVDGGLDGFVEDGLLKVAQTIDDVYANE